MQLNEMGWHERRHDKRRRDEIILHIYCLFPELSHTVYYLLSSVFPESISLAHSVCQLSRIVYCLFDRILLAFIY